MLKLVLDTNTIVSGLLWRGNEFQLLQKIEEGKVQLFITQEILEEISNVLNYPRLTEYIEESGLTVEKLLEKIASMSTFVIGPKQNITICRDKKDNKIIECAVNSKADYIVSGDNDLLDLKEFEGIKIFKTTDILKSL